MSSSPTRRQVIDPDVALRGYEDTDEVTAQHAKPRLPPPPPPPLARPPIRSAIVSVVDIDIELTSEPDAAPEPDAADASDAGAARAPSSNPPASSAAQYCRHLLREFERAGDRDGAYRAAVCLEALGEADINGQRITEGRVNGERCQRRSWRSQISRRGRRRWAGDLRLRRRERRGECLIRILG